MKPLIYTLIILLAVSCKKETETKTVEKEVIKTNTVVKKCRTIENINLDTFGNPTSKSVYYYTLKNLDSIVAFNPINTRVYTIKYEYLTSTSRKSYFTFPESYKGTYTLQYLNEYGEVIESKSYSKDGKLSSWAKTSFDCN